MVTVLSRGSWMSLASTLTSSIALSMLPTGTVNQAQWNLAVPGNVDGPGRVPDWGLSRAVPLAETEPVAKRVWVREIDDDEGRWLVRIVRRDSGSVVT